jgi:DNA polymerase bacteriophage-type
VIRWDDSAPVFWDCETQSAAELRTVGGRLYAADPSTRVLTAVFHIDGVYHVWIPAYHDRAPSAANVWPAQLGAAQPVEVHHGGLPAAVRAAVDAGRTFVAHNAFGFDRFIWEHCIAPRENVGTPPWADTIPAARAGGYPGKLDSIARELVSEGKDAGHRILMKHIHATATPTGYEYPAVGAGALEVIARYNVADVELLRRVWAALDSAPVEADVIDAHDAVNHRGIRLDESLARKLTAVSGESVQRAADRIAELTGGELSAKNLRSTPQVNAWLASKGVRILSNQTDATGARKLTLRKEFVAQALANPWLMVDEDAPAGAEKDIPPEVFEVLRLRSAALRITGAKGERAVMRASADSRARDLHTYHQAHTGRWSSAGIQIHNLPRPKKGVPVETLLAMHESGQWGNDSAAAYEMIARELPAKLTVDDALSSLLRPLFVAEPGHALAVCDYAAVECRGIAWIAGEETLLDALASGRDVYREFGARLFGKPAAEVTDLERHVAKQVVLGCGYGLGADKFRIYCGLQNVDLAAAGTDAESCVEAYRAAYPAIAGRPAGVIEGRPYRSGGVWSQLAKAAMSAVTEGGVHAAGRTRWAYDGECLRCELPSGRVLHYRRARVEDRIPGYAAALGLDRPKPTLVYQSTYGESTLYGGKIAENVVQAICRDLLATALVGCERAGLPVVLHVHDEIVAEVPLRGDNGASDLERLAAVMVETPEWAAGFPVGAEAFCAPRYLKAAPKGWPHTKRSN